MRCSLKLEIPLTPHLDISACYITQARLYQYNNFDMYIILSQTRTR